MASYLWDLWLLIYGICGFLFMGFVASYLGNLWRLADTIQRFRLRVQRDISWISQEGVMMKVLSLCLVALCAIVIARANDDLAPRINTSQMSVDPIVSRNDPRW
jgi:hypothetical protein